MHVWIYILKAYNYIERKIAQHEGKRSQQEEQEEEEEDDFTESRVDWDNVFV